MSRQTLQALLVASVVLLAGCAGGISGSPGSPTTNSPTTDADQTTSSPTSTSPDAGTVAFYISDEENAISDFQHLNVTVTRVGFERAGTDGGGWAEREVDNETVDLTTLQGANATLVNQYTIQNGTYSKVFVHVSNVNATLQNGEQVRVKLPSEKLQLTNDFTVTSGSDVDFVFDITVHKAGNSGKYILKPVISESGTDVPIKPTGNEERREDLKLQFVGNLSQSANATVEVTRDGEAVANATVLVNEEDVGTTDSNGRVTFGVPRDENLKVTVTKDDHQAELEVTLDHDSETDNQAGEKADAELNATFVGTVSQGENATLSVTQNGSAVENATVVVNDETVGTTDTDGKLTVAVPNADTLTVVAQVDDAEVELEYEFESDDNS
ncbi:FAD/FMN-dependent dehydrogenase [Halogeometricum borinquense DSM 11551]|uniref:FAD/FMN-dependent dehydrogenase n=2 Tax=Halogeometricum borinquense TaxID=60847 RepID=E4NW61_HALBP|nr:DUF4382 domain-containing protein [Halogeometricum borinquense]ADQ69281.1 FAD/FMN-dependent dehydrogenase [Halogeometricum borinquense DSM 11551]ELY31765.1 FAD/FMN-dependent dehydrogenase [Halogeometricum borinquense DSM 11551]RYJ08372.1 DUF4382 domain-containing protein [Halogeometricum borinquense]